MDIEKAAMDIFVPVMESALVYAGHYCKACGRDVVTSMDLCYGWRYAARTTTGNKIGSFFPEVYDDVSSTEEDDEFIQGDDETFTRYEGTEELYLKMNEIYDTWEDWEPFSPAEKMLKNAIDSGINGGVH